MQEQKLGNNQIDEKIMVENRLFDWEEYEGM